MPSMHASAVERFAMRNDLRHALERGELSAHYQPILRLSDGRIVGAEALMRWTHPERGSVSPLEFIPLAEEAGWIIPLGEWILRAACQRARSWVGAGSDPLRVSVNLSPKQFTHGRLVETVRRVLEETGLEPHLLELEVTENIAMLGTSAVGATLSELRDLGVRIAIDDFGTGYSSLDYLKRFPIHTLKVDRSFVCDVSHDAQSRAITNTVIVLGQTLDLVVVAEGVETELQRDFLKQCRCDEMQGFLFSPAVPADQFEKLLAADRAGSSSW
jgi:EAL domain-containing protein (putative c-di-GMP-specific phosphodiesterase class I)